MTVRELETEVWLPSPTTELFQFLADVRNLEIITPPWLRIRILTPQPIAMRKGTLIDYRLRLRGFPLRWRTCVTCWDPPYRFVSEQLRGPYRRWIHEHTFERRYGGTIARNKVSYAVPLDFFCHALLIRPDLDAVFAYGEEALKRRFTGAP